MKKLYYFLLLANFYSYGQIIDFPDPNFKALLLQANTNNNIAGGVKIDINSNGEIEQNEALLVYVFVLPPGNITSLVGIEYFTNLMYFSCPSNQIISLDLSNLTQLITLGLGGNQITNLNLTGLTYLEFINCGGNQITELNFSTLTALEVVICGQNLFTELDFSNNLVFDQLSADECPNLTTIKINNNYPQNFSQTPYNGCWVNNPNLVNICVDANEVAPIQTFLSNCNITQPINIATDCILSTEDFVASSFSIAPNPTSGNISFDNSKASFQAVSVYNYLGQEILSKKVETSSMEELNLSNFESGIYILRFSNDFDSVSINVIKE